MVGEISQIADNMGADLQNEEMQPLVAEIGWNHNGKLSRKHEGTKARKKAMLCAEIYK